MSISLTRILQQITGLNTFFAGPSASRDNGVVLLDTATVTWGTDGQGNIQATASGATLPTATGAGQVLTSTGAGTTYTAQALPVGSATQGGIVEVDGTTITASAGVISAAPSGVTLIQKQTVSGGATTVVTFTSIPQTYTNLRLMVTGNSSIANTSQYGQIQFNGDTGTNYEFCEIYVASSTVENYLQSGQTSAPIIALAASGAVPVGTDVTIFGYTSATSGKPISYLASNPGLNSPYVGSASWSGTAAISSLTVTANSGDFAAGSVFSLYGIK